MTVPDPDALRGDIHTIISRLTTLADTYTHLHPSCFEQRAGGERGGSTVCSSCGGKGRLTDGRRCEQCVVAIIGDVGDIVVQRVHMLKQLERVAAEVDSALQATVRAGRAAGRLADLVDVGASRGQVGPPTVEHFSEVEAAWAAKGRRVAAGETPGQAQVQAHALEELALSRKRQEQVDQAAAARAAGGKPKRGWRK